MYIYYRSLSGKLLTLEVEPFDKVYKLKYKIQIREGICSHLQNVKYGGKQLEDDRTLADYNIQNDSTIDFSFRIFPKNVIYIVNGNNRILEMNSHNFCFHCHNFSDLKKKIQDVFGLKTEFQELSYKGKILKDSENINELGLGDDCEVQLKIINPSFSSS